MGEYLFIASAIFSIVNGTALLCVNPRRVVNRVFFGSSVCITIWFLCVVFAIRAGQKVPFESAPVVFWIRFGAIVSAFSIWLIWLIESALLEELPSLARFAKQSWPWLAASLTLAMIALSESFIPSTSTPDHKGRGVGYVAYALISVSCWTALLIDAVKKLRRLRGIRRVEMQFYVIGAICACILIGSSHALGLLLNKSWLRHSSSVWFAMLHGVTVWAVCYHRVFDAKQVILSIGHRLGLLIFAGLAAMLLAQFLSTIFGLRWGAFLGAAIVCGGGIVLDHQSRRWVGLDIRQRALAPRQQIIDWAREISDEQQLRELFSHLFRNLSGTDSVYLVSADGAGHIDLKVSTTKNWPGHFILSKEGWITPETLQRSRAGTGTRECAQLMSELDLGALLSVPKGRIPGSLVIGLGRKQGQRPYTFPDMQILLELAELMDNILTHSRVATHAAHIERMASAAMISRGLAHDLNNLATPVASFLCHMEMQVSPGTTEAMVLNDAKASIRVMQEYIQESLFFVRRLEPNFVSINARALLTDIARLSLDRARDANVQVLIGDEADFPLRADPALLRRLLQNLVFNAIDASPPNSVVKISAFTTSDGQVHFQVADNGAGISQETRTRIFEPYYTTKHSGRERRGLGLGLAICQKIVELHGGRMIVAPNSPQGTVFTATLPTRELAPVESASLSPISSLGTIPEINGA